MDFFEFLDLQRSIRTLQDPLIGSNGMLGEDPIGI